MKLWLLKPIDELGGPWNPWYDKSFGFVVRAESETAARDLVTAEAAGGDEIRKNPQCWQDPQLSSCTELTTDGEPGQILCDFRSA